MPRMRLAITAVLLRQRLAGGRQPEVPLDEVVGKVDVRAFDLVDRFDANVAAFHAVGDERVVGHAIEEVSHRHLQLEAFGETVERAVDGRIALDPRPHLGRR